MQEDRAGQAWGRVGYGVDIQGDQIVAVRAERGRKGVALATVSSNDSGLRDGAVALAMGPRESITQWLEVAFGARAKALRVLPTVLDIQLPFAIEQCAYAFPLLRRTVDGRTRALGVAARFADVERKLAQAAALGLDPVALDHEGLALWTQSVAEMPGEAAGAGAVRVLAYRGVERATLVVGVGGEYRSAHAVRLEHAAQVRRLIRSAAGESVQNVNWWWTGPGAVDRAGCAALLEGLRDDWSCTAATHRDPASFLARALATRLVSDGPARCNLRMGSLAHPAAARRQARGATRALGLALAAGLVLCAANLAVSTVLHARGAAFEAAFQEAGQAAAGRALGGAKGEQALTIAKRQVASQRASVEPYRQYLEPDATRVVHAAMTTAAKGKLIIETLEVKPGRVTVSGRGNAWESAAPLVVALDALGMTASLQRSDVLPDGSIPFSVTAEAPHE